MACLFVFLMHYLHYVHADVKPHALNQLALVAFWAVPTFFILSGFLLSIPFWNGLSGRSPAPDLRVFWCKRFARIAPAYFACILILALCQGYPFGRWNALTILSVATFSNTLLPTRFCFLGANGSLWTIPIEFQMYGLIALFFALASWMLRSHRRVWCFGCLLCAAIVPIHYGFLRIAPRVESWVANSQLFLSYGAPTYWNPIVCFKEFLLGALAAPVYLRIASRGASQRSAGRGGGLLADGLLLGIAAIIIISDMHHMKTTSVRLPTDCWPIVSPLIAVSLVIVPFSRIVRWVLETKFLRTTAQWSFGIYLWHAPIQYLLLLKIAGYNYVDTIRNGWLASFYFLACLGLSYALGALSFHAIERPVMKWMERRLASTREESSGRLSSEILVDVAATTTSRPARSRAA